MTTLTYPAPEPKKLRHTHDALVDAVIAYPGADARRLGALLDYTPTYINILMRTDMFKERLAQRRDELVDPILRTTIQNRLDALAERSLEVMLDKLNMPVVSDKLAADALDISLKAKGYGARMPTVVQTNFVVNMPAKEQTAEEWAQKYRPAVAQSVIEMDQGMAAAPPETVLPAGIGVPAGIGAQAETK